MEKIQVNEELKGTYLGLVKSAQTIETGIGAAQYRLYKLCEQRALVDVDLKTWWENVSKTYSLDKTKDFYVDGDGAINIVERPEAPAAPAPVDPDVKPEAVVDPAEIVPEAVAPVAPEKPVATEPETVGDLT